MKNNFIDYLHKYSSGGKSSPIHIKKENRGKFTQSAKEHGMGVQEYAQSVLNNPNASALQKKRANFARNAKVWKHEKGAAVRPSTNQYQENHHDSTENYEPTYYMGELAPVYVTAKATPEERNKAQLRVNEQWRQYQENYAKYQKAKDAAELAQQQRDFNAHIRKGMNNFARNYIFPTMVTALTAGTTSGASLLPKATKAADVLWNPAATITSRFASPLVRGAGKAADMIGVHLPVYRETAADIASKVRGDKNWFTDQQGNFDPMTTAETVFAPFIGAGAVKEGKLMGRAINGASNQLYKSILRVAPENPSKGFEVQSFPGYQLKGLMKGSQLEKQLSKTGTININQLNAYFNKASQIEREVANKVLNEKFAGQKTVDYNQFKKAVQDELIGSYTRVPQTEYADYGMESLGFETQISHDGNTMAYNEITGEFEQVAPFTPFKPNYQLNTFTFESPRIPYGNNKHYRGNPIGHSRTYTLPEDPRTLYVMESQSDWAQSKPIKLFKEHDIKNLQDLDDEINFQISNNGAGYKGVDWTDILRQLKNSRGYLTPQGKHLSDNYLQRQLQENLKYAAENGQTKMRYPTRETAAKIEGYPVTMQRTPEYDEAIERVRLKQRMHHQRYPSDYESEAWHALEAEEFAARQLRKEGYNPQHETILKKYDAFPKQYRKLYKNAEVKTVTDTKGNTWYEVDVPEGYLNSEWQFKSGGVMKHNPVSIKYSNKIK